MAHELATGGRAASPELSRSTPGSRCACRRAGSRGRVPGARGLGRRRRRLGDEPGAATAASCCAARATNGDSSVLVETTLGRLLFNEAFPPDFAVHRTGSCASATSPRSSATLVDHYTKAEVADEPRQAQGPRLRVLDPSGLTISIADVRTPVGEGRDPRQAREGSREGRAAVRPRHHHRRRAAPEGSRDLDRRHQPGDRGDAGRAEGRAVQPHRDDGRLGCPRKHHAGPPDRRHARPGGQPAW